MTGVDFVGAVLLIALIVVNVNAILSALPVSQTARLVLATGSGLWIGLQIALASSGFYVANPAFVGAGVGLPLAAAALVYYGAPGLREAALTLPPAMLVGLNTGRVLGVFFLILAANGRLGGPFPQSAGWGDIIAGALAAPLAFAIARGGARPRTIFAWNLFGALDLVVAGTLGLLSIGGAPLRSIDAGPGSDAMGVLPWILIPTVLVPLYLMVHGIIFAQLMAAREGLRLGAGRSPA